MERIGVMVCCEFADASEPIAHRMKRSVLKFCL